MCGDLLIQRYFSDSLHHPWYRQPHLPRNGQGLYILSSDTDVHLLLGFIHTHNLRQVSSASWQASLQSMVPPYLGCVTSHLSSLSISFLISDKSLSPPWTVVVGVRVLVKYLALSHQFTEHLLLSLLKGEQHHG